MKKLTVKKNQSKKLVITKSGQYQVTLAGEGAHVDILGGFHLTGRDQLDINVITIHAAAHTTANTLIKAIGDDSASITINGTIIVEKLAQQTNSFLNEHVLLLSPTASAHAIPNLEIEADDVKCSHAATVGTIDQEQLFYLASRGIQPKTAKQMIADGFLADVNHKMAE